VFAAHTGLGLAASPRQLLRDFPLGRTLHIRMWLAAGNEVPPDPEDQVNWLYGWWERIDDWIEEQGRED
jgi:hypothetical protein